MAHDSGSLTITASASTQLVKTMSLLNQTQATAGAHGTAD